MCLIDRYGWLHGLRCSRKCSLRVESPCLGHTADDASQYEVLLSLNIAYTLTKSSGSASGMGHENALRRCSVLYSPITLAILLSPGPRW
jgi:hypothetical protein